VAQRPRRLSSIGGQAAAQHLQHGRERPLAVVSAGDRVDRLVEHGEHETRRRLDVELRERSRRDARLEQQRDAARRILAGLDRTGLGERAVEDRVVQAAATRDAADRR
jgi:hypothetical protein